MGSKSTVSIFSAGLSLALFGCGLFPVSTTVETTTESTTSITDPRYVDGVLVTGDAGLAVIEILSPNSGPTAFECVFDEIAVDVLLNRIVIKITIDDDTYQNYTYVTQMKPVSGTGNTLTSYLNKNNTTTTHTLVYDDFEGTGTYRFLVAKYYEYLNLPDTVFADATAGFTIRFPSWDQRKHLGVGDFSVRDFDPEQTNQIYTELGRTQASITLAFLDPEVAVTTVKIAFYEASTGRLAADPSYSAGTARDSNGYCRLVDKRVTGLAPDVAYHVYILVSGNDGVSDFIDRTVADRIVVTDAFWGTADSAQGMYAYVVPGELTTSDFHFTVKYFYDGETFEEGIDGPIQFVTRIRDDDDQVVFEAPIGQQGSNAYAVGFAFLSIGCEISIESASGGIILCKYGVPFEEPTINVFYSGPPTARTIIISWDPHDGTVIGGSVQILHNGIVVANYDFDQWSSSNEVTLPMPGVPSSYVNFWAHIDIVYTVFDGNDMGIIAYSTGPIPYIVPS